MAEENGLTVTDETKDTSTTTVTTVPTETGIVDKDGNFVPTWRNYLDEGIRDEKSLETFKNVKDLARSFVDTKRMVGKDKIAIPNEKSTDGEWDAYYKAGGRPDVPDAYKIDVPEELKDYYDDPLITEAKVALHKAGLSQKQMDVVMALDRKRLELGVKQMLQEDEQEAAEAERIIDGKMGTAKQKMLQIANSAIEQGMGNFNDEERPKLLEAINDSPLKPYVFFWLAEIGKKFQEHGIIHDITVPTPGDLKTKINDAMDTDAYKNREHPGHKAQVALVQRLFTEKAKAEGRTA